MKRVISHSPKPARRKSSVRLYFDADGWSIDLVGCAQIGELVDAILTGWSTRLVPDPGDGSEPADAKIVRRLNRYEWHSTARERPHLWKKRDPRIAFDVLGDVHDVLFDWFWQDRSDYLGIHCGAVKLANGLICFPNVSHAGKSTLCAELASQGVLVYCDDVLPVHQTSNEGLAMGIAPRLRFPLPPTASTELRSFVRKRMGPKYTNWGYLRLGEGELEARGKSEAITAIVLLNRVRGAPARLESIGQETVLSELIAQNFITQRPAISILDQLIELTNKAGCYELTFSATEPAAKLLKERFADPAQSMAGESR